MKTFKIRRSVFETNSSSVHSVTVVGSNNSEYNYRGLPVLSDGYVHTTGGEFGWEVQTYSDPIHKLEYIVTMLHQVYRADTCEALMELAEFKELSDLIANVCSCNGLLVDCKDGYWDMGYIDHQSCEGYTNLDEFLDNYSVTLEEFIFNPNVQLHTDNDNHY